MTTRNELPGLLDELATIYDAAVAELRTALASYLRCGDKPSADDRAAACSPIPSCA